MKLTPNDYQYDNINLQLNDNFIKILTKRQLFKNVCVGGGGVLFNTRWMFCTEIHC